MKEIPSPPRESQSATAARLSKSLGISVSRDQVRRWAKRGYDLGAPARLAHQLRMSERPPAGLTAAHTAPEDGQSAPMTPAALDLRLAELQAALLSAKDYEEARTIRVQISGIRELFRVQCDRGLYVTRTSAHADGAHAATASKAAWEGIESDLPPRLEGLSASAMAKELRAYSRQVCQELAGIFGRFEEVS